MRLGTILAGVACAQIAHASGNGIHLNELYISHAGTDDQEFVELVGSPSSSLDGYAICIVEGEGGAAGTLDDVIDLTGLSIPGDGYFVAGGMAVPNVDLIVGTINLYENGTETVYLVVTSDMPGLLALAGTNVDADGNGVTDLACSSDIEIIEAIGLIDDDAEFDRTYDCVENVGPDGSFLPAGAFRPGDYPSDFCADEFLDFDDTAGSQTPGGPNAAGSGTCRTAATTSGCSQIIISEIDADTEGNDSLEFVELYSGCPSFPLDDYTLVLFNGNSTDDVSYRAVDLTGFMTGLDGYLLIGNADVVPLPDVIIPGNGIQNGTDAVGLYASNVANFPNGTFPSVGNLVDAVVYDTNDSDDAALLAALGLSGPQLNEGASGDKDFHSNQRCELPGNAFTTTGWIAAPPTPRSAQMTLGTRYCPQNPNSSGRIARISAIGSTDLKLNDMTLVVCDLPPNENGYFLVNTEDGFNNLPALGLSNGNFCLGGGITLGRYFNDVINSGDEGQFFFPIDLTALPQAEPPPYTTPVMPGDVWYFQCWYRDSTASPTTNNFTDAIRVEFLEPK
ncbi:MAG: hypothetical protein GY711_27665 [bacterium]|nr:hypothetical protein [bacterium]